MTAHLLSIDNLEPLLHLATLCAPALLVGDQGDVGVIGGAVVACAAFDALPVVIVAQVIIAATGAVRLFIFSIKMHRVSKYLRYEEIKSTVTNIPLCELQVRCVVNHRRRFPIQCLPF